MRLRAALVTLLSATVTALPAPAQTPRAKPLPSGDPIDALLNGHTVDPDEPDTATEKAYAGRLRASGAAARSFRGPLEGGWSLMSGGREVYVLELADRNGVVEGAWRDPRRVGVPDGSGYIDAIERSADTLTVHIGPVTATLHNARGAWAGDLAQAGRTQPVTLRRREN